MRCAVRAPLRASLIPRKISLLLPSTFCNPHSEGPSVFSRICKPLLIRDIQLILAPFWLDGFEKIMAGVEFGGGVGLPALHPALAGL